MTSLKHIALSGCAAALLSACGNAEPEAAEPRPVAWLEVGSEDGPDGLYLPGRVRAAQRALLSFEVGGVVTAVNADIGDRVGRGSTLASLSATTYRYQLSQAEAQLAETRAQLVQAQQDAARQERLFEEGAASESRLETARAQAGSLSSLANARSAQIGVAREALSDTRLRAPFSGRIARRLVEPGTQVSPGQPVLEIDGAQLEATFVLPASRRQEVAVGDTVSLRASSGDPVERSGRIADISSRAGTGGAFEVVVDIAAADPALQSGEIVEIMLPRGGNTSDTEAMVMVPLTAVRPEDNDSGTVFVIDRKSGLIAARPVELGRIAESRVAILSGLTRGDVIVAKGVAFLEDGDAVKPIGQGARRFAQ